MVATMIAALACSPDCLRRRKFVRDLLRHRNPLLGRNLQVLLVDPAVIIQVEQRCPNDSDAAASRASCIDSDFANSPARLHGCAARFDDSGLTGTGSLLGAGRYRLGRLARCVGRRRCRVRHLFPKSCNRCLGVIPVYLPISVEIRDRLLVAADVFVCASSFPLLPLSLSD